MGNRWLEKSSGDLHRLVEYLITVHGFPKSFRRIALVHDPMHDEVHAKDARAFCYVTEHRWEIYCAAALDDVTPEVRMALLLHELVHLKLPAFSGARAEVSVDTYILETLPEAGYIYKDYSYWSREHDKEVTAKALQCVSKKFVEAIFDA